MRALIRAEKRMPQTARRLEPELLDELPADDPRAIQSRRDLRRVNAFMGNVRTMSRLLHTVLENRRRLVLAEIGAGDGTFLLKVAQKLKPLRANFHVQLIDRQQLLTPLTIQQFGRLGWTVEAVQSDIFDWLKKTEPVDLIVANLFLHHFDDQDLPQLFASICSRTTALVACEPRRFSHPGLAGLLVRLIGCNSVTHHDAVASVRAGFIGQELSAAWPEETRWILNEREAGLFSHSFSAQRPP
jgi:hypothetical protein